MAEETIWKGTTSHWKNFTPYAITILSAPACAALYFWLHTGAWIFVIPEIISLWAIWRYLLVRTTSYHLSTERFVTTHGILTKVTDTLELYRVRDMQIVQPLLSRIIGLQNIHVFTNDSSTSELFLDFIPASLAIGDKLRKAVEECRTAKRVRTMDVLGEPQHPTEN